MLPQHIRNLIEHSLGFHINNTIQISGGSINRAIKIVTEAKPLFLKWNDANLFPGMFDAEAKGLQLLRSTNTFFIPEVIFTDTADGKSFLILEWIESGVKIKNFWNDFGLRLAKLHRHTSKNFGLDHNNYIGSLQQSNVQHSSWINFFINERLTPQLKRAVDSGKLPDRLIKQLANLSKQLPEIIPKEKPSLLHGDLWNGNFMTAHNGSACLVDPAVYYGHREMDLAMTKLFGGFDREFYEAYNDQFPLEKDFDSRVDIYNLYPLLVHVNLFGGGYVQQVQSILSEF